MKSNFMAAIEYVNQPFDQLREDEQQYFNPRNSMLSRHLPCYECESRNLEFDIVNRDLTLGGYKLSEIKRFDDLKELIHPNDLEGNVEFALQTMRFAKSPENIGQKVLEINPQIIFRIRGKGGKIYWVRKSCYANGYNSGVVTHTFSYWEDISYMGGLKPLSWKLTGPNSSYFDFNYPELSKFKKVLTERETELLRLVARGFSSNDIGRFLCLSPHTINTHRKNMLRKLDVANTPELLTLARDMNLIA